MAAVNLGIPSWEDRQWRADALCAQVGGDLWFPDMGGSSRDAKTICTTCPVQEQCFEFAVNTTSIYAGIWGGRSIREVMAERRKRRLASVDIDEWIDSIVGVKPAEPQPDDEDEWGE